MAPYVWNTLADVDRAFDAVADALDTDAHLSRRTRTRADRSPDRWHQDGGAASAAPGHGGTRDGEGTRSRWRGIGGTRTRWHRHAGAG